MTKAESALRFRDPPPGRLGAVVGGGWIRGKTEAVRRRRYGAYALVYLTAGSGWYEDARGRRATVAAGDCIAVFPELVHGYGPQRSGEWSEVHLTFSGPLFDALAAAGLPDREEPVWRPGADPGLVAAFADLVRRLGAQTDDPLLGADLHRLLVRLAEAHRRRRDDPALRDLAQRACAVLAEDLHRPLDLAALARRLGAGYDRLRRAVTRATGSSPQRWRMARRIEAAKALLAEGCTLAEVAERLGWCDQFLFARQFRRIAGEPPGAWRRRWRGEQESGGAALRPEPGPAGRSAR